MDDNLRFIERKKLERVAQALQANNMQAHVLDTAAEVAPFLQQLIPAGSTVSVGGSVTLDECGVLELLRNGSYTFLDRYAKGIDVQKVFRDSFSADYYLASANAITEEGEVYEMDGRGNRVAAIAFGPNKVVLVAGRNKIVEDVDAAALRNARVAAPANCHRLGIQSPCANSGVCNPDEGNHHICSIELVLRKQNIKDRILVVLVNEELGY